MEQTRSVHRLLFQIYKSHLPQVLVDSIKDHVYTLLYLMLQQGENTHNYRSVVAVSTIPLTPDQNTVHLFLTTCKQLYRPMAHYTLPYWSILHSTHLYWPIAHYTLLYWSILHSTQLYWPIAHYTLLYWSILHSTQLYWPIASILSISSERWLMYFSRALSNWG